MWPESRLVLGMDPMRADSIYMDLNSTLDTPHTLPALTTIAGRVIDIDDATIALGPLMDDLMAASPS